MLIRAIWWISLAWLIVCVGIVCASMWSWISRPDAPLRGESTIAAAIGVLYAVPAVIAAVALSWSPRSRAFKLERSLALLVIAVGVASLVLFEVLVP
jgi:hypothetical protein